MLLRTDVLILGAGVVGLSIGSSLLESNPGLRVVIVEKEDSYGAHASGRNSGVLHAGFYYSPDSLKARFCRDGNSELKELCTRYNIPIINCGKVVVTCNEEQEDRLDTLFRRGIDNGVSLELLEARSLANYEPLARTHRRFMWSPNTAISDSNAIIHAMVNNFRSKGGKLILGSRISISSQNGEIIDESGQFKFSHLVNSTGAQADRLATKVGVSHHYAMVPFMGIYRSVSHRKLPLRTLVYPVPHKINPFLGVHFSLTTDGKVKIGPTAIPILGREQYSLLEGWSISDMRELIKGTFALIKGKKHDFSEIARQELPKLFQSHLVSEASLLVPSAAEIRGWERKPPGIRAQLVHLPSGRLEQDFVVQNHLNSTHILNAVSPGWTSSIPFGRYVAEEKVLPNLD